MGRRTSRWPAASASLVAATAGDLADVLDEIEQRSVERVLLYDAAAEPGWDTLCWDWIAIAERARGLMHAMEHRADMHEFAQPASSAFCAQVDDLLAQAARVEVAEGWLLRCAGRSHHQEDA